MAWLVLIIIAWGALAFGSVYDWARWPLLAGCVVAGAWGFLRRVPHERRGVNRPVLAGLVIVAAAVCVQLVPLDHHTLRAWSPATDAFLRQADVRYALAAGPGPHAPYVDPEGSTSTSNAVTPSESQVPSPESRIPSPEPRAPSSAPFSTAVTHPLSINPRKTWVGLACLTAFGFMLLGLARGLGGHGLRTLAPGIVALGVLMSMIGIVQKALWNGKVYGFWEPINKGVAAFGPFINRNHFAGWMLMALPVAVGYFAAQTARGMVGVQPGWRHRIVWFSTPDASRAVLTGFAILVMGVALALTLSRSGLACFLLAMALSAFNVLRRQAGSTKGHLLGTYLMLVFVAAVAWAGVDAIGARFAEVDWALGGRAGAWGDAWRIHRMFPWFGTGLNTYGTATLLHQQFEKATAHYVEAHNDYLQLLVEGGWMVAVPALLLLGLFAREIRRRFAEARDDRTGYWLRVGAVTGIAAIAFQEIVDFSLQMPGNAALFTVLCAMAIRKATVKRAPSASVSRPASSA